MQLAKKVPFEDPNVLNAVRALYLVSNLIIAAFYAYIKLQIDKKKGAFPSLRFDITPGPTAAAADLLSLF